jgi:hypothetical protein
MLKHITSSPAPDSTTQDYCEEYGTSENLAAGGCLACALDLEL